MEAAEIYSTVTLDLDGDHIVSGQFARAVNAFFRLINAVADEVSDARNAVTWSVSVHEGSALVRAHAEPDRTSAAGVLEVLHFLQSGIEELEEGIDEPPAYFNDTALRAAEDLGSIAQNGVERVAIHLDGRVQPITRSSAASVNRMFRVAYQGFGSIEGKLEMVSMRKRRVFAVYEDLSDLRVECYFEDDQLETVREALHRRVSVTGEIRYRSNGKPISINVDDIRVFRRSEELPGITDVLGILGKY